MSTIGALLELVRFDRTAAAASYTLLGAYLVAEPAQLFSSPVLRAMLVVGFVVAFGFAINDYCDIEVDLRGRPHRPIPSGRISRPVAFVVAWGLAGGALAVAATLGQGLVLFTVGTLLLSTAYSYRLKSTLLLGNAAMAVLVAAIPVFGALAAGQVTGVVLATASMMFPFVFAQEVLYNVEDEQQDRDAGLRTTATQLGRSRALLVFKMLAATFVVFAILPWVRGIGSDAYLYAILPCSVAPTLAVIVLLSLCETEPAIRWSANATRLVWLSSVLPLILLKG
jgi:geranylgeranylglycerol-phosphate geranylgeranyltransferase